MTTLLPAIDAVEVRGDVSSTAIRSVEFDSRRVGEGSLFCCVPGARTDGHLHAAEAVGRGASALLCERVLDLEVTQARVAEGGFARRWPRCPRPSTAGPGRTCAWSG